MIVKADKQLGKRIKSLRKKLDLKQSQLAEKTDLTPKYIQMVEAGRRRPSLSTLRKISVALKVKMTDLFS